MSAWIDQEEERSRLTREALADVVERRQVGVDGQRPEGGKAAEDGADAAAGDVEGTAGATCAGISSGSAISG